MNDNEFWVSVWIVGGCVVAVIAGAIAWTTVKNAPLHREAMEVCVKAGGSWQNDDCFLVPRPR